MGCGVSHFAQKKEPEMESEQNPNDLLDEQPDTKANRIPLLSNSVHYYSDQDKNNNDMDDEIDDGDDEFRSQNLDEKDYYDDLNRELQNINSLKYPGSPSFREYCCFDQDQFSKGIDEGANDRTRFVEEHPDMEKESSSDQISVVKKVSRVRRIRSAISRRMIARRFLLSVSCYNKATHNKYYTPSLSTNHSNLVSAKP